MINVILKSTDKILWVYSLAYSKKQYFGVDIFK